MIALVSFWHEGDMAIALRDLRFWDKADMGRTLGNVRLRPKADIARALGGYLELALSQTGRRGLRTCHFSISALSFFLT